MTRNEILRRWPNATESFVRRNLTDDSAGGSPSGPKQQSDPLNVALGKDEGKTPHQVRCLVRVTSFRRRLCDERNLHEKAFTDSLVEAGAIVDDSEEWAKVEVSQQLVEDPGDERTVIEIKPLKQE